MLELDIIKQHVRLELDDDTQDSLLESYAGAAWDQVQAQTGRNLYVTKNDIPVDAETGDSADDHALVLNDAVTAAMLLMIGHWFENREVVVIGASASELPMAVNALIKPYQHYNL